MPFVFVGGVMCNSIIKARLAERFDGIFAEPAMSADNAVGVAALTLRAWRKKQ
jgi:tRNA A37 threonylcarbamoyltransferase TsaD